MTVMKIAFLQMADWVSGDLEKFLDSLWYFHLSPLA